jgi:hypothetical protein
VEKATFLANTLFQMLGQLLEYCLLFEQINELAEVAWLRRTLKQFGIKVCRRLNKVPTFSFNFIITNLSPCLNGAVTSKHTKQTKKFTSMADIYWSVNNTTREIAPFHIAALLGRCDGEQASGTHSM